MAPEHRFETGARLTREVVAAFCDGGLSLQESPEVLHDALIILAHKDLKVRSSTQSVPTFMLSVML